MKVQPWKLINYDVFLRIKPLSISSSSNISDAYTITHNNVKLAIEMGHLLTFGTYNYILMLIL